MPDDPSVDPVRKTEEEYGSTFKADLLEQYKLYVQSAENISSSRISTSRYLLTLSAALLALYGFRISDLNPDYLEMIVPLVGMFVSALWHMVIKSYGELNKIKFRLIHKLEERLPATLFKDEWNMARQEGSRPYTPVTRVEQWLPRLFAVAHGILGVVWVLGRLGLMELA